MKIQQLRYFVCIADKGSVRAAAEALGVSAAAISQALRELESTVGVPLLSRGAQGTLPTYTGRQLLVHARLILGQVARAEEELALIQGRQGGTLSLGVTPWVAQSILPRALINFRNLRPEVSIDVCETLGTAHPLLRDGTLDLVIGLPPPRHLSASFYTRDLFNCGLAVIAGLGYCCGESTSLADLADANWVLTLRQDGHEQPLNDMFKPFGLTPSPEKIHFARSTLAALSLLQGSDMLTVCPWPLVETPLFRNSVRAVPIKEQLPEMVTSLVARRSDPLSSQAQLFIECFKDAVATCIASDDPALKSIMNSVEILSEAS